MIPSDNFKPAPMTSNEERRLEALKRLGVIGTEQGDIFDIYSELALEVSGFFAATCWKLLLTLILNMAYLFVL